MEVHTNYSVAILLGNCQMNESIDQWMTYLQSILFEQFVYNFSGKKTSKEEKIS